MTADSMIKNNVTVEGNADAVTTIIFAHGFGTDKNSWDNVNEAFKADYRLVLYDNVGGGNSDPDAYSPIKYNTLHTYADDLLAIAEELDLTDAIIIKWAGSLKLAGETAIRYDLYGLADAGNGWIGCNTLYHQKVWG